jgi:hypothetical protein
MEMGVGVAGIEGWVMWSVTTNESWAKNIKNFKFSEEEDAV